MAANAPRENDPFDSIIIGGGPAGLCVSASMQRAGLRHLVFERGAVAHHISLYPPYMTFLSTKEALELDGFPMTIVEDKPTRRQYLAYLARMVADRRLPLRPYTTVETVTRGDDGLFTVRSVRAGQPAETHTARTVVVACGAFDRPRRLGVPGEELPKVHHRYVEPHPYVGQRVLVVGGRNSGIETALALYRAGAHVSLSYRGTEFTGRGIKYWLLPDIENRLRKGEITGYLGTEVQRIDWQSVTLRDIATGRQTAVANDFVIVQIGYEPPVDFLRALGIHIEPDTTIPVHNPATLESSVPGLYIAGSIIEGNVSGKVFIENSREHGEVIVAAISAASR